MLDENRVQQKNWFRFFPDGTIEFTVITRVLAIILLASLMLVPSAHRALFLVALAAVIWFDYIIVLWWALQIGCDLENLAEPRSITADDPHRGLINNMVWLAIPSIAIVLLIAPWPELVIVKKAVRDQLMLIVRPALGVIFIVAAYFSWKILAQKGVRAGIWRILILIPGLHWFAIHRHIGRLQTQLGQGFRDRLGNRLDESHSALTAADVTLALCFCFYILRFALGHSGGIINATFQAAGIAFAALFAVIDLAAMEKLQRQFVTLIRKL